MTKALILGVNGQDGSYLAEALIKSDLSVVGFGRDPASRYVQEGGNYRYLSIDLADTQALANILNSVRPDIVYHFAAVHGAVDAGFTYEVSWREMMAVNVFALHAVLEYARYSSRDTKVIYAGSSKVFVHPLSGTIDESTPMKATCLYGIGKLAARDLLRYYRIQHGIRTTNLILFNHDSPRRPRQFFLPTIAAAIKNAKSGKGGVTKIRTLDFRIDWSAADELMELISRLSLNSDTDEAVIASGRTVHARDVVNEIFASYGLCLQDHIVEETPPCDPGPEFHVDISKFAVAAGLRPEKTPHDIVDAMISSY